MGDFLKKAYDDAEKQINDRFKFRVWDKGNKRYQGTQDWQPYLDTDGDVCFINTDDVRNYPPENTFIIEQCTGFSDKNGKLIYEGDIVVKTDRNALGYGRVRKCQVIWDKKLALFAIETEYGDGYALSDFEPEQYEIIGNRHEQKE